MKKREFYSLFRKVKTYNTLKKYKQQTLNTMYGKVKYYSSNLQERGLLLGNRCGICKTLSAKYGFFSRLFLNNDIVLLNFLLSNLSQTNSEDVSCFKSANCFKLPENKSVPIQFEYSAAINILLAKYKIEDNIIDNKSISRLYWKAIQFFSKKAIESSEKYLESIHFPIDEVSLKINEYLTLEKNKEKRQLSLDEFSQSMGNITGLITRFGINLINGKKENELEEKSFEIGSSVGRLMYLIDAVVDLERDIKTHNFNPLKEYFELNSATRKLNTNEALEVKIFLDKQYYTIRNLMKNYQDVDKTDILLNGIKDSIEELFTASKQKYLFFKTLKIKFNAFKNQITLLNSRNSYSGVPIFRVLYRKLLILGATFVTVFILGCYDSAVPLSNQVAINKSLIGKWSDCSNQNNRMEFTALNNKEYLMIETTYDKSSKKWNKNTKVVFLSKINGTYFLNFEFEDNDNNKKIRYYFAKLRIYNNSIYFDFVGEDLFKRAGSKTIQFESSRDLTNYFSTMMNQDGFYEDEAMKYCK